MPTPVDLAYRATETTFTAHSINLMPSAEHDALLAWCRQHGLNPDAIPTGTPIIRCADGIRYTRVVLDTDGRIVCRVSGEPMHDDAFQPTDGWPEPWPSEIAITEEPTYAR